MAYLKTIGLENFRLFKDKTVFELAPITILTGINNSGKSSLIKSLQLFKSSIKATGGLDELNFTGGRHNLGHFGLTLNNFSENNQMTFTFDFPVSNFEERCFIELTYYGDTRETENAELIHLKVFSELGFNILDIKRDYDDTSIINIIKVDILGLIEKFFPQYNDSYFEEQKIMFDEISDPSRFNELMDRDREDYLESISGNIFNWFQTSRLSKMIFNSENWDGIAGVTKDGLGEVKTGCLTLKEKGIHSHYENSILDFSIMGELNNIDREVTSFFDSWVNYAKINHEEVAFTGIFQFIVDEFLHKEINQKVKALQKELMNSNSLSSVRANSERLYFNNSTIVDINQLLLDFSRLDLRRNEDIIRFINNSLIAFNIGDEIVIRRHQGLASEIFVKKDEQQKLLADMGFGFTQLIPIILKIALVAKSNCTDHPEEQYSNSIFLLEEPESNLHPSYQSKLAELIIDAAKAFNIQFIIETHSEYLIRNFQYLTATKQIPSSATKIYYFHQPGSEDYEEAPYRVIEIMKDGRLSNEFGEGFFDEIPRLLAFLYNSSFN